MFLCLWGVMKPLCDNSAVGRILCFSWWGTTLQSAEVPVSETACIFHPVRSLHEIQPQALEIDKRIQFSHCSATAPLNRLKNQDPSEFRYHTFGFLHSGPSSAEYSPTKILYYTGGKTSLENKNCDTSLRQRKVLIPDLFLSHKSSSQKRQNQLQMLLPIPPWWAMFPQITWVLWPSFWPGERNGER